MPSSWNSGRRNGKNLIRGKGKGSSSTPSNRKLNLVLDDGRDVANAGRNDWSSVDRYEVSLPAGF